MIRNIDVILALIALLNCVKASDVNPRIPPKNVHKVLRGPEPFDHELTFDPKNIEKFSDFVKNQSCPIGYEFLCRMSFESKKGDNIFCSKRSIDIQNEEDQKFIKIHKVQDKRTIECEKAGHKFDAELLQILGKVKLGHLDHEQKDDHNCVALADLPIKKPTPESEKAENTKTQNTTNDNKVTGEKEKTQKQIKYFTLQENQIDYENWHPAMRSINGKDYLYFIACSKTEKGEALMQEIKDKAQKATLYYLTPIYKKSLFWIITACVMVGWILFGYFGGYFTPESNTKTKDNKPNSEHSTVTV